MKRKLFMIITSAVILVSLVAGIVLFLVSGCIINEKETDYLSVKRYGYEIPDIIRIASYDITLDVDDQTYQTTEKEGKEIILALDKTIWYKTVKAEKTSTKVIIPNRSKSKIREITLCENNVIYYDGKYFVSEGSTAFHDAVISTANELLL